LACSVLHIFQRRNPWLPGPAWWSEYADESWCGAMPGKWGMQPRMLHMLPIAPSVILTSVGAWISRPPSADRQTYSGAVRYGLQPFGYSFRIVAHPMPSKADLVYQARSGDCGALQAQEIVDSYVLYGTTAVARRVMQLSHRTNAPEWLCTAGHEHFIPAHAGVYVGASSSLPMPRRILDSKCWARQSFHALHFQRTWHFGLIRSGRRVGAP